MFLSKRSDELSNRQMQPGESLFQYLKRKKHLALRQSLESSLQKFQTSRQQTPIPLKQVSKMTSKQQKKLEQHEPLQSGRSTATKRRGRKSSAKKRKIDSSFDSKNSKKENDPSAQNVMKDFFKDQKSARRSHLYKQEYSLVTPKNIQQPVRNKTPQRSFISMISPLKNRENIASMSITKNMDRNVEEKKSTIGKITEFSTKKMIKQVMTKVQKHYTRLVEFEQEIKDRLKDFFIKLNSFVMEVQEQLSDSSRMEKKVKQVKSAIKLLNGFVASNSPKEKDDLSQLIESLYREINQIIDGFQGQVQKQSRSSCQQMIQKLKDQYEGKIEELNKEKIKINRQLNLATKETAKIEKEYNKLMEKYNKLEQQQNQQQQDIQERQEQALKQLQQQLDALSEQNDQLMKKLKQTETKLKQSEHKHQQFVRKTNLQHQEQLNSREAYLLKELSTIKEQCANDINNLNKYYLTKIEQYPLKIKNLEDIIQEQTLKIQFLNEKLKITEAMVESQRVKILQAKKKADDALVDMFKVNEELFKHWLALKDVKTLLTRLGMFDKFERIYRDIPYDQFLFLL